MSKKYTEEEALEIFKSTRNWTQKLKLKKYLPTKESSFFNDEYDIGDVAGDEKGNYFLIIENIKLK